MKIWIVQIGEPLPLNSNVRKMRSVLLAEELSARGHDITYITSAFDHVTKTWNSVDEKFIKVKEGYSFLTLKGCGYSSNVSLKRLIDHRKISKRFLHNASKMEKPDLIQVSMPPHDLAYSVVRYAKEREIPVVVDIRDLWPDYFLTVLPSKIRPLFKPFFFYEYNLLNYALKHANAITANCTNYLQWGLDHAKRKVTNKDRVFYLGFRDTAAISTLEIKNDSLMNVLDKVQGKFVVAFMGIFSITNNPSLIIETARRLKDNKDIVFVLAGDGVMLENMEKRAQGLDNVFLTGWLNLAEIAALLKVAKLGICTSDSDFEIFPNKACAYFSAALPVISSFKGELATILERDHLGINVNSSDIEGYANAVRELYENQEMRIKMAKNAREIYEKQFNTANIYKDYAGFLENIVVNEETN